MERDILLGLRTPPQANEEDSEKSFMCWVLLLAKEEYQTIIPPQKTLLDFCFQTEGTRNRDRSGTVQALGNCEICLLGKRVMTQDCERKNYICQLHFRMSAGTSPGSFWCMTRILVLQYSGLVALGRMQEFVE